MATVLVIDDQPHNGELFADIVRLMGHQAILATRADEGIALMRQHRPTLVVMDIMLPEMDGWEASRLIKADPDIRHIPIIAITAAEIAEVEEKVRASGCDDYIPKPFTPAGFMNKLRAYLDGK